MKLRRLIVTLSVLVLCLAVAWPAEAALVIKSNSIDGQVSNDPGFQTAIERTVSIAPGEIPLGATVTDVNIKVLFHKIDGLNCAAPGTGFSFASEISLKLTSPQSTAVFLVIPDVTYTNDEPAPQAEVTFDDEATFTVGDTNNSLPITGTFKPEEPLSAMDGESPVGTWILEIRNDNSFDALCFFHYELTVETSGAQPGVTIEPLSLQTSETGSSAQFTVVLNTQPTSTVLVSFSTSDATEGDISPTVVTFGPSNWDLPKNITVTGKDDLEADGDIIYFVRSNITSSSDTNYNGLNPADVIVVNSDDEVPPPPTPSDTLLASVSCDHPNMLVRIFSGQAPFRVSASSPSINVPKTYNTLGVFQINGPDKWDDLTVAETSGDEESVNLGTVKCRPLEIPIPELPAHQARLTIPRPLFRWSAIPDANRYRVFLFDNKVASERTVDIRQNSVGSATQLRLDTPLDVGRYFWRVRGRVNRVWGFWSVRFTLFIDPATTFQGSEVSVLPDVPDAAPPNVAPRPPSIDVSPPQQDGAVPTQVPAPDDIGDTAGLMTVEADDPRVVRTGVWNARITESATNGSFMYSTTIGDSLALNVTGNRVGFTVVMHPSLSTMVIEVDGVAVRTVRTTEAEGMRNVVVGGLSEGVHTVRVFGQDGPIGLDAFLVVGVAPFVPGSDGGERPSDRPLPPNATVVPPPTVSAPDVPPTEEPSTPVVEPPNSRSRDGANSGSESGE
ncbi:MAG: hypothetical protein L0154_18145 [Chloroflexi bacterium]|nr:hypothetical protein [Chloroflexota bacterium]